ncbi:MAG: fused MFS/spermidine synthase [Deltaproteobacteria bacterium]|nr:fused MFS/spermidine synthase [Deltaproteobacteria bacterium]
MLLVYSLFFLSGISGLAYEIVWARQLGLVFGNTDYAVATTLSVFMFGLGIGSLVIGVLSDRHLKTRHHLVIGYCVLELLIGLLGVFTIWLIPELDVLSVAISSYQTTAAADGFLHLSPSTNVWRFVISFALLTPSTFLMGGTLPLLSKLVASNDANVGKRIGYLFMFNTLGAAFGCFLTDYASIRTLGVLGTGALASGLNLLVAGMGWGLLGRSRSRIGDMAAQQPAERIPRPDEWDVDAKLFAFATAAFAVSGFCGMALEIIWYRALASYLLGYRAVLSSVLTIVLLGFVAGSFVSSRLISGRRSPLFHFSLSQVGLGCSALLTIFFINSVDYFGVVDWIVANVGSEFARYQLGYAFCLTMVALVVALPAFFMGWAFPLVNAFCQRYFETVGSEVGRLYMFNTLGAVAGSLLQGFVLTPLLGIQNSLLVVSGLAILSGTLLLWRQEGYSPMKPALAVSACLAVLWWLLPSSYLMDRYSFHSEGEDRVVYRHEGKNESILVLESPDGSVRSLNTNGFSMSDTSGGAQRYMKLMAHFPLMIQDNPRKALVIAYGVGNTAHAVSLHDSLDRIDVVDLSEDILSVSGYFEATNGAVLDDPRVHAFVNDGRHHLILHAGAYDLITSEPPPLPFAHTVNLYTQDYYELIRQRLTERGFFTQWLPVAQLNQDVARSAVKAFVNAFPHSVLISGYRSNLILMGSPSAFRLDTHALQRSLDSNDSLMRDLQSISAASLTEIIGSFVMGERGLEEYTADVDPVSDDQPSMEYSKSIHYLSAQDPRIYDGMAEVWEYVDAAEMPLLRDYLALMEILYHERAFLETSDTWMKRSTLDSARRHYRSLLARGYRSGYLEHFLGAGLVQELRR